MAALKKINMVDLQGQYRAIQQEVDAAVLEVMRSAWFIGGPRVSSFQENLSEYLNVKNTVLCGNGTDALQIAMMALDLKPGDEVIVPAFTYVATAEVIGLLGLKPIMADVDLNTFNIRAEDILPLISNRTKAIVPVHLFGQSAEMDAIMNIAEKHGLYVVEDNAQAIGADYFSSTGLKIKTGGIGHIGCTSFYPSKNLGAYGDAGAIFTNDEELERKIRKIANHGQAKIRYYHDCIGVNSRLDAIQAAVLDIKLKYLDSYHKARLDAADFYDRAFKDIHGLQIPFRAEHSTHVFHQYTLRVKAGRRDALKTFLAEHGIASMIYYPVPLYKQKAYASYWQGEELPNTEVLCKEVISLPMHTELTFEMLEYITDKVKEFFA